MYAAAARGSVAADTHARGGLKVKRLYRMLILDDAHWFDAVCAQQSYVGDSSSMPAELCADGEAADSCCLLKCAAGTAGTAWRSACQTARVDLFPQQFFFLTACCCWVSCREAAACQIYDELVTEAAGSSARRNSAAASPRPTTGPLPWLYYVPGTSYMSAEDVDLQ